MTLVTHALASPRGPPTGYAAPMELYVCWGTFRSPRPGGHPCRNAAEALRAAGWEPEVKRTYGLGPLPAALTPQRAKVRELTGQNWVPVLVTDDGEVIHDSRRIVAWAEANPAAGAERAG
jgi:hypothetical protein